MTRTSGGADQHSRPHRPTSATSAGEALRRPRAERGRREAVIDAAYGRATARSRSSVGPGVVERREVPRRSPSAAAGRPAPGCGPAPDRASTCRAACRATRPRSCRRCRCRRSPGPAARRRGRVGAPAVVLEPGQRRQAEPRVDRRRRSSPTARVAPRSECRSSRSSPAHFAPLAKNERAEQLVAGADGEHHRAAGRPPGAGPPSAISRCAARACGPSSPPPSR